MKKIVYLVAPLMVLPCMMSCNKAPMHKVVGVEGINLDFTTMNGKELKNSSFNEGQDFKFKVKAHQEAGELSDTYTVLPDAIGIYVGDSLMPLTEGYTVEFSKDDETEAVITIKSELTKENIYVEGIAKKKDNFIYNALLLHNVQIGTNIRSFGYFPKTSGKNGEIGFIPTTGHTAPKASDFLIATDEYFYVSGDDWFDEHIAVTEQTNESKLVINGIQENDAIEYVLISAKSNDTSLLESYNWDEIKYIAHSGYAKEFFSIGETKKVSIGELEYEVKIIGFNHDKNENGEVAPITFQFTTAISNKDAEGKFVPSIWDSTNNANYPESGLNKTALVDLFGIFPDELKRNVMEVQKEVGVKGSTWDIGHCSTNLFPLAHAEMSTGASDYDKDGEGTIYEYYEIHKEQSNRVFCDNAGNKVTYWLRTPVITGNNRAWAVDTAGAWRYNSQSVKTTHAVVPAFCI